jgi:hypothetical protein
MITWEICGRTRSSTATTGWTGSLCQNGVVAVRRTIRFDPRDYLLPRTSRECVEWVSHTQPHFDGLIVLILKTRCDSIRTTAAEIDSLCDEPLTVTFKTGPLTVTFTQEELVNLHKVIPVDDAGNAVAFNTLTVMPGQCPQGFLAGQWRDVDGQRYAGVFRGKWVSRTASTWAICAACTARTRWGATCSSASGSAKRRLQEAQGHYGRFGHARRPRTAGSSVWFRASFAPSVD